MAIMSVVTVRQKLTVNRNVRTKSHDLNLAPLRTFREIEKCLHISEGLGVITALYHTKVLY